MQGHVLALSPHCDDVPLSIGAFLLSGKLGPKVDVCVVFSVSRYTRLRPGNAPLTSTTELRNAEERHAAEMANYQVQFLAFPEPFAREGYSNHIELYDCRPISEEPVWSIVDRTLTMVMSRHIGLILSPMGCGNHIDHRMVFESVKYFLHRNPMAMVGFYEDLPYGLAMSEEDMTALLPQIPGLNAYTLRRCSAMEEDKLKLLGCYQSQFETRTIESLYRRWHRRRGERIWFPARMPDLQY